MHGHAAGPSAAAQGPQPVDPANPASVSTAGTSSGAPPPLAARRRHGSCSASLPDSPFDALDAYVMGRILVRAGKHTRSVCMAWRAFDAGVRRLDTRGQPWPAEATLARFPGTTCLVLRPMAQGHRNAWPPGRKAALHGPSSAAVDGRRPAGAPSRAASARLRVRQFGCCTAGGRDAGSQSPCARLAKDFSTHAAGCLWTQALFLPSLWRACLETR